MSEGDAVVEATGETVGEAKWAALRELELRHPGVDKTAVRFEVVSEGERGLLGVGYAPARVLASVPAESLEASAIDESGAAADARSLVGRVTNALGVVGRLDVVEDDATIVVTCSGEDVALLIGRHGQTIDAVQYLLNAISHRAHGTSARRSSSTRRATASAGARRSRLWRSAPRSRCAHRAAASSSSR